jgi:hypothetical protein
MDDLADMELEISVSCGYFDGEVIEGIPLKFIGLVDSSIVKVINPLNDASSRKVEVQ